MSMVTSATRPLVRSESSASLAADADMSWLNADRHAAFIWTSWIFWNLFTHNISQVTTVYRYEHKQQQNSFSIQKKHISVFDFSSVVYVPFFFLPLYYPLIFVLLSLWIKIYSQDYYTLHFNWTWCIDEIMNFCHIRTSVSSAFIFHSEISSKDIKQYTTT